ncbi:MAG: carboxypeptidase-like regulatory domain-containing protein [Salinivirgaceae bacterium]|nr:carboxypeptidase-like regulatory domain-containing protein [Salinivirgaceae bacterium]
MKLTRTIVAIFVLLLGFGSQASAQQDIKFINISKSAPATQEPMVNKEGFSILRNAEAKSPLVNFDNLTWVNVGNGSSPYGSYNFPIDFFWNTSVSQSIYTAEGINHEAVAVEQLKYIYKTLTTNYPDVVDTEPIKIWMANTTVSSLADENGFWIPFDQFTLVYDGIPTLTSGVNQELIFSFNEAFVYNGANLCIMVERTLSPNSFMYHFNFKASTLAEGDVKSRLYGSYETPFDFNLPINADNQTGMTLGNIADVSLGINIAGGSLAGTITNTDATAIAGAKVSIAGTDLVTYSTSSGTYSFPFMVSGSVTVNVSAFGYISNAIAVEIAGATTQDVVLDYLPQGVVSGTVLDNENNPISGASIKIIGYETHQTTTNVSGNFSIPEVYYSNNYTISFSKNGYTTEIQDLIVDAATIGIPTVHLTDILECPSKVEAVKVGDNAEITWLSPYDRTIYRTDGGQFLTQFGHNYMEDLAVFGQVFREPAKLYQMSWYTKYVDESHDLINVFVFALDNNGLPTNTIIYELAKVPNVDDQWTRYIFPDTITVQNGFYIAISYKGRVEIGIDAGADPQYPYVNNVNYVSENYLAGDFIMMEEIATVPGNFMIRAEGYNLNF